MNQDIIILPEFKKTFEKKGTSQTIINAVDKEIKRLKLLSKDNMLFEYLNNQNGKSLKGHQHQYKYRFSSGDRIFYTYGKYVEGIKDKNPSAIVIYNYSKHDDQDRQIIPKVDEYIEPIPVEDSDFNLDCFKDSPFNNSDDVESMFNSFQEWRQTHAAYVFNSHNISTSLDDIDVYLSEEQIEIVNNYQLSSSPLLILGGAGTGKTIMALHILNDYKAANPDSKCIYFTQSDALRGKAKSKYEYIVGNLQNEKKDSNYKNLEVNFKNINRFCIEYYNKNNIDHKINTESEFSNEDFYVWCSKNLDSKISNKLKINTYDLWAEIRGTIKGGLNNKWQRPHIFSSVDFNNSFTSILEEHKLIKRVESDPRLFYIVDFKNTYDLISNNLDGEYNKYSRKILNNCSEVDYDTPILSEQYYYKISEENSTLQKENRREYYNIANDYQTYLKSINMYDDNDLVMKLLSCPIKEEDKYDFIVIDEIQDYTELQLYAIFKFAKNKNSIVMAGDNHQIINPTIFSVSRLKEYFQLHGTKLETKKLSRNFRCPYDVVKIANITSNLSKEYIAAQDKEDAEKSEFSTLAPFVLSYDTNNIIDIVSNLIEYPGTVILVPSEDKKNNLIDLYGREKYLSKNNPIINTVSEIKGMEYKYVVTVDLISYFKSSWDNIFNNNAKQQTRFRYYFNLFYVAITRTQQFLCFIENEYPNKLYELIENKYDEDLTKLDKFNLDVLCINQLTDDVDSWLESARKELEAGNYETAKNKLKHVPDDTKEKQKLIYQCDMKEAYMKKDFIKCLKYALLLEDSSLDQYYSDAISSTKGIPTELNNIVNAYLYPDNLRLSFKELNDSLNKVYSNDIDKTTSIKDSYINKLSNFIFEAAFNTKFDQGV